MHCPLEEENVIVLPTTYTDCLDILIRWNQIIGTPDHFSKHTYVPLHSGWETLDYGEGLPFEGELALHFLALEVATRSTLYSKVANINIKQ